MSQSPLFDASIPVLTEVLHSAMEAPSHPDSDQAAQMEALAVNGWSAQEWNMLERRLSERILHQLQASVGHMLEQRMADVLHRALEGLTSEIGTGLQNAIEKIVARAVAQEVTHLQAMKK